MNLYRPRHFALVELVCPALFKARGERCWELLQPSALMMLDALREKFGPIVVNNWSRAGEYAESGLREFATSTGAEFSMHKFGGAYDCKFKSAPHAPTPHEAFSYVLAHPSEFPLITAMENVEKTLLWLHFDVRNHSREGIWVVEP